jgi:hypothetical protein
VPRCEEFRTNCDIAPSRCDQNQTGSQGRARTVPEDGGEDAQEACGASEAKGEAQQDVEVLNETIDEDWMEFDRAILAGRSDKMPRRKRGLPRRELRCSECVCLCTCMTLEKSHSGWRTAVTLSILAERW